MSFSEPGRSSAPRATYLALRLSLFYGANYAVLGVLLPFWPVFLTTKGMGPGQIGLLLALSLWSRVAASPAVALIADLTGDYRRPMIALGVAGVVTAAAFAPVEGFWALLLVSLAFFFAFASLLPLGEALTLRLVSLEQGYGRIRVWGSVAFIVAAALGGWLLDRFETAPADVIFGMLIGCLVLTAATCMAMPAARAPRAPTAAAPLRRLLGSRSFLLFLGVTTLIHGGHTIYYGFGTLHWQASGLPDWIIGLLWGEAVVAEILLFTFAGRLVARLGVVTVFYLAAVSGVVRWLILGMTTELWAVGLAQALHAVSFGAMHLAAMLFIVRTVPAGLSATAQGLYAGVSNGAGLGIGLLLAGALYGAFGGAAYYAGAGLSLGGVILNIWLARAWRGEPITIGPVEGARPRGDGA